MGSLILPSQFFLPLEAAVFHGAVLQGEQTCWSCPLQGKAGDRVGSCHTSHPNRTLMCPLSLVTECWSFSAVIMVWLAPHMGTDSATVCALQDQMTEPCQPVSEGPRLSPRAGGVQATERQRQRERWTERDRDRRCVGRGGPLLWLCPFAVWPEVGLILTSYNRASGHRSSSHYSPSQLGLSTPEAIRFHDSSWGCSRCHPAPGRGK